MQWVQVYPIPKRSVRSFWDDNEVEPCRSINTNVSALVNQCVIGIGFEYTEPSTYLRINRDIVDVLEEIDTPIRNFIKIFLFKFLYFFTQTTSG